MIERSARRHKYTIIDSDALNDEALDWDARGLLAYLLAKPDHWRIDREQLEKVAPSGARVVRRILGELETLGYLTRERYRDELGRVHWKRVIHEIPVPPERRTSRRVSAGATSTGAECATGGDQHEGDVSAGQPTGAFCTGGERADIEVPEGGSTEEVSTEQQAQASQAPPADADEPVVVHIKPRRGHSKRRVQEHPQARELCDLLADLIAERVGERPRYNGRWLDAARLLLTKDGVRGQGYAYEDLVTLIYWTQEHEFWQGNILSMPKLREKRFVLISQFKRDHGRTRRETAHERARRESMEELDRLAAQEEAELRRASGGMP